MDHTVLRTTAKPLTYSTSSQGHRTDSSDEMNMENQSAFALPQDEVFIASNAVDKTGPAPAKCIHTLKPSKNSSAEEIAAHENRWPEFVKVNIYPQNYIVGKPEITVVKRDYLGHNLENERFKVKDENHPLAVPDLNDNYLYKIRTPQFAQVQAMVTVNGTLEMCEDFAGRKLEWSFGNKPLTIHFDWKEKHAAFWDGKGTIWFEGAYSRSQKKIINTALDIDTISHETGHAIHAGLRFQRIGYHTTKEHNASKEAFAECIAMLYSISNEANITELIRETGGDLSKQNRMADCGEIWTYSEDLKPTLRDNALNDFKYKPASELLRWDNAGENGLGWESHNYGRVFMGAFYDCFKALYDRNVEKTMEDRNKKRGDLTLPELAAQVRSARDIIGPVLIKAMDFMSPAPDNFKSIALGMIKADEVLDGGAHRDAFVAVFKARRILTSDDVEKYEKEQKNLPSIKLDKPLSSKARALDLLKRHQDKLEVNPEDIGRVKIIKDNYGLTFVRYFFTQEAMDKALNNKEGEYSTVGGLTLTFRNATLVSRFIDEPVNFQYKESEYDDYPDWPK